MSSLDGSTKYLLAYWLLILAYGLVLTAFFIACQRAHTKAMYSLLAVLVIGPAAAYPIAYFLHHSSPDEQKYVMRLAELWGPLWAALSGMWALWAGKSEKPKEVAAGNARA